MAGVLELGGVAATAFAATTSLGIAGYGHANKCFNGYLRRGKGSRSRKESWSRRRPVAGLDGILTSQNVLCRMNGSEPSRGRVEFNGEVLFADLSDDGLKPIMAVCNSEVSIDGCRVTTAPLAPLPTMELVFERESDAREWAMAMRDASKVCEPHVRIQELVSHIVAMEKHIKDLRGRANRVGEYENQINDLRKSMGLLKLEQEGVHTEFARRVMCSENDQPIEESTRRRSWFAFNSDTVPKERYDEVLSRIAENVEELERYQEELKRHQAQNDELKIKLSQQVDLAAQNDELKIKLSQQVDPDEHQRLQEETRYHREECRKANEEIEVLRRRIDEAMPVLDEAVSQSSPCSPSQASSEEKIRRAVEDVEDKYANVQRQLASAERNYEEERLRADSATTRVDALIHEKEVLMSQIEELKNAGKSMLETMNKEKTTCKEEDVAAHSRHHISVEQLQRQIDEMHISFRNQMQAAQEEFTRKLEERQRQYETQMKDLQDELYKKHVNGSNLERHHDDMLVITDSELTAKVGVLAQENLHLKTQLSQKAQRLEMDSLALQSEADRPIARPATPLRQSVYAPEVKTLLNNTPRSTVLTHAQAIGIPTSTTSPPSEVSPLARITPRVSTPVAPAPSGGQSMTQRATMSWSPKQSSPRTILSIDSRGSGVTFPATGSLPVSRVPVPTTVRPSPVSWRTGSVS